MTEVIHSPSSSSSASLSTPTHNTSLFLETQSYVEEDEGFSGLKGGEIEEAEEETSVREKREKDRRDQLSILALLLTLFRKTFWLNCKTDKDDISGDAAAGGEVMEIGWPTDVEHLNHVVFDRYDGFLGLPVEFEPEVPRTAPSASTTVFGVSTESMQLSYDSRGNSIPTILLLLQKHLYSRGGLQAEGIFRINAGNSQEEYVREQLNRGVIPEGVDVHCLAGLIKAWFRELPRGVLDSLSHEQLMQCASADECDALVRLLPLTEAALLDWAVNLMADVVQEESRNKMNERNIAMVFAPNMTKMADPLNALMHAVQVMNFLKTLIEKNLRSRGESATETSSIYRTGPSDDNGNRSVPQPDLENLPQSKEKLDTHSVFTRGDAGVDSRTEADQSLDSATDEDCSSYSTASDHSDGSVSSATPAERCQATRGLQNHFEENDRIRCELSI